MAVVLPSGAVFLHVPKTGGSWVNAVLADQKLVRAYVKPKHVSTHRFREFIRHHPEVYLYNAIRYGPYWHRVTNDTPRFFFVRNPLSWYESLWRYMDSRGWQPFPERPSRFSTAWHPKTPLYSHGHTDFNVFMARVLHAHPGYVTNLYHYYDAIPAEFVGHQENLADDLIRILTLLNERFDEDRIRTFPRVNESGRSTRPVWEPLLREKATRLEYAALVKYGYLKREGDASATRALVSSAPPVHEPPMTRPEVAVGPTR